jgi:predicted site-specific integrase-resolvase
LAASALSRTSLATEKKRKKELEFSSMLLDLKGRISVQYERRLCEFALSASLNFPFRLQSKIKQKGK